MNTAFKLVIASAATVLLSVVSQAADNAPAPPETTWESIRGDIFDKPEFMNGEDVMALDAPYRAEDAAIVPISVDVKPQSGIRKITVVIDENPAPVAASFKFGEAAASASFSTRFRVNNYTWIRAIGETDDGRKFMVKRYVKASGGCSAPAGKDADLALAEMGKMKFRVFEEAQPAGVKPPAGGREAQVMLRHPNYSGLQMDQVTMLAIPARFVDVLDVTKGGKKIVTIEGGISLSEDPNIRFFYRADEAGDFSVHATDTDGAVFDASWPAQPDS